MLRERRATIAAVAVIACALTALLLPALAAAASQTFTVDNLGDTSTKALCENHITNECTLRGAIEAANATTDSDTIHFASSTFDGEGGFSTIVLGSALPTITEPVEIDGTGCTSAHYNVEGPCAEVDGSGLTTESDFTVDARLSSIRGIAINGGKNGIVLAGGTELFFAANDWFGVTLDGFFGGASGHAGVLIEPGAKNAVIGGETVAQRNVFDESPVGVEIRGASENQVEGNYIGLYPNGAFRFGHSLGIGVRVIDSTAPAAQAEFNEIGGAREAGVKSQECTGACNAIAAEAAPAPAIAIAVESATGPTTISGNYLGIRPDGSGPSESRAVVGVLAIPSGPGKPGPGGVTIGGATPATEGNLFTEGEYGVKAEGAEGLEVLGNSFGFTSAGAEIEDGRALETAVSVSNEGLAAGAVIDSNSINAEGAGGIENLFVGSEIVDNKIVGGAPGIYTGKDSEGIPNLIEGNGIANADTQGILVENDANVIVGNTVLDAGSFGIGVEGDPHEYPVQNRIGGDAPAEENRIEGSAESAILIAGEPVTQDEVAGNFGAGNGGPFIRLSAHSTGHPPNGEIKPPTLGLVQQSSASGTAEPGAKVRIFTKASSVVGELGRRIGIATADSSGNWTATFAAQPVGQLVAATQTSTFGGTSEVSTAVAASADPTPSVEPEKKSDSGSPSPSPTPTPTPTSVPKAPKVKFTAGPKKSSSATTAKFKFKAEPAAGATFECKLDNAKWAKCRSPKTYKELKVGKHTFRVRATASGLTGAAATYKFTVKE